MKSRVLLYAALVVLYLLHNDFWLWQSSALVAGLPVGLAYHTLYCVVVSIVMALLVRFAWPYERSSD